MSWLRPVDNQQHNSQRMDVKIKLQQSWRRNPSSHGPRCRRLPPCSFICGCRNKRIQSVVLRKTKQCRGRTLLKLALGRQRTHLNTPSPFPTTDADAFRDISTSQQDQLLADFASVALTRNKRLGEEHMTTNLAPGPDGTSTAFQRDVETSSWTASASKKEGTSLDTSVCTVWQNGHMEHITSKNVLQHLQSACAIIESACLGFEPHKVGTHSLWPGGAMEMYLGEVPVYTIMPPGRWSSDTFLQYIQKQVEQFLWNVVKKMITFWSFCHFPDIAPQRISSQDPRQHNHCNKTKMRTNIRRKNYYGCSYWPSPFLPNQRTGRCNTINGRIIYFQLPKAWGGRELRIKLSIPNPIVSSAHPVHFFA